MKMYNFKIIELDPEVFYKTYGGTNGNDPILDSLKPLINRPEIPSDTLLR